MKKRAVCLQHVSFEGPGAFAPLLEKQGYRVESRLVPAEGLPKDAGDFLLVMGGPMSVNDPDAWIKEEIGFIEQAVRAGMSVLGVCLGAQLMAKALGARVRPGRGLEIGMTKLQVTAEGKSDPWLGSLPHSFEVFEWHGEVFKLPAGAVPLASSEVCPLQAFRFGSKAYGLLFHLEIERSGIEALCRECPEDLHQAKKDATTLIQRAEPHLPPMQVWADKLIAHLTAPIASGH
jgi:GMP synthase-like glutamine amidotransferase